MNIGGPPNAAIILLQPGHISLVTGNGWSNQPKTVQSRVCGNPGEYLDLPYPAISGNISKEVQQRIGTEFLRLRYGVWEGLEDPLLVTSQQYARCRGKSARAIIMKHPDFRGRRTVNFTEPSFKFTKLTTPKYVIVLENSVIMNTNGQVSRT